MSELERLARIELAVEHNAESIEKNTIQLSNIASNCHITQLEYTRKLQSLEDKLENGFREAIREAVKENLPNNITVTAKTGLSISDKVLIAIITGLTSIIVALITGGVIG